MCAVLVLWPKNCRAFMITVLILCCFWKLTKVESGGHQAGRVFISLTGIPQRRSSMLVTVLWIWTFMMMIFFFFLIASVSDDPDTAFSGLQMSWTGWWGGQIYIYILIFFVSYEPCNTFKKKSFEPSWLCWGQTRGSTPENQCDKPMFATFFFFFLYRAET